MYFLDMLLMIYSHDLMANRITAEAAYIHRAVEENRRLASSIATDTAARCGRRPAFRRGVSVLRRQLCHYVIKIEARRLLTNRELLETLKPLRGQSLRGYDNDIGVEALGAVRGNGESVMRNPIEIDYSHSRAIIQEIGERLRKELKEDRELPAASGRKSTASAS